MQSTEIIKTYRETAVKSTVLQGHDGQYYLQVPDGWAEQDVVINLDGKLEQFVTGADRVTHSKLVPFAGQELEVYLIQMEEDKKIEGKRSAIPQTRRD